MIALAASTAVAAAISMVLFTGAIPLAPIVADLLLLGLAGTGAHIVMGLMEAG